MSTDEGRATNVVPIHTHAFEEPEQLSDQPRRCVRCGIVRNDHPVPTVVALPVDATRLWNIEQDGVLWFARGVNEAVARDRADRLGASVVTCLAIPAQQTDWATADYALSETGGRDLIDGPFASERVVETWWWERPGNGGDLGYNRPEILRRCASIFGGRVKCIRVVERTTTTVLRDYPPALRSEAPA